MKRFHATLIFLVPLIGFVAIIMGLNSYQYFRIRADIAAGIVTAIGATERDELRAYLTGIDGTLRVARDLGQNDILVSEDSEDIISLNKKFIPLLEQQASISSILVANDLGQEYLLTKAGGSYLTRVSRTSKDGDTQYFQEWSAAENAVRSWQESNQYDPRNRPWFPDLPGDEEVHWAKVYPFFRTKELGVTASVSWKTPDSPSKYTVLGVDIPLSGIKSILSQRSANRPGLLFLVTKEGNLFAAGAMDKVNSVLSITSEEESELETGLIKQWQQAGNTEGEVFKMTLGKQQWLAVFQKIDHNNGTFWLGLAASETDLLRRIDSELYRVDFIDLIVAAAGALLILLFLRKRGLLHRPVALPAVPLERLREYILQGEGPGVEFKSTVRTNLQQNKRGKEIEIAWLKAVSAFLNSDGGTLLLGVDDSGKICGIEADEFENSDRCLLHVKNLLNQHIGAEFSGFIITTMVDCAEGSVVMLECRPAGTAVFLKIGKNEEFFVRSGPSSTKLSPSQTVSYMAEKNK